MTVTPALREAPSWWRRHHGGDGDLVVAYFCLEFGVDERLPTYSGGLGMLAGDHLKAASDLGVPLVGVGLFYRLGYFRQALDESGQAERYVETDPAQAGLVLEETGGGPLTVTVELAGEVVTARVWRSDAAGVPLYLLDADGITDVLYGGDREHRLRQELLLGVGGPRALAALGVRPTVFHVNEGHAAFLGLERLRALVEEQERMPGDALAEVRASTVFTTHTPVPAGNERFDVELVRGYASSLAERAGIGWEGLLELGSAPGDELFGLTPLALRTSGYANAVSQLHGEVARDMWRELGRSIGHVTNGVHRRSWQSPELAELLARSGVDFTAAPGEQGWECARALDLLELWRVRTERKRALLAAVSAPGLSVGALTIGFARRFATYKRAGLLLSDRERLGRLLGDPERPVQLLVAGKAHPADDGGKALIKLLLDYAGHERGRVVFLPDYDVRLARLLVQGVDLWLNTPRRPQEACGTSGMKAALNGALNLSTLDGWWAEGYTPETGWAFGERDLEDDAAQDAADALELYRVLEEEVVPAFYERDGEGVPVRWLEMAAASIEHVGTRFGADRMVTEYADRYYVAAHRR